MSCHSHVLSVASSIMQSSCDHRRFWSVASSIPVIIVTLYSYARDAQKSLKMEKCHELLGKLFSEIRAFSCIYFVSGIDKFGKVLYSLAKWRVYYYPAGISEVIVEKLSISKHLRMRLNRFSCARRKPSKFGRKPGCFSCQISCHVWRVCNGETNQRRTS